MCRDIKQMHQDVAREGHRVSAGVWGGCSRDLGAAAERRTVRVPPPRGRPVLEEDGKQTNTRAWAGRHLPSARLPGAISRSQASASRSVT